MAEEREVSTIRIKHM